MPFLPSFFLLLNGGIWTAYAVLDRDIFIGVSMLRNENKFHLLPSSYKLFTLVTPMHLITAPRLMSPRLANTFTDL
jgi:hypothetical protein